MMNKKEKAHVEELEKELRLAKAMRFTIKVKPDVMPPAFDSKEKLRKGWLFSSYSNRVEVACTSALYHSFGTDTETRSQNPMPLYSTKKLALMAMRNEVEIQCVNKLASIDSQIEKE